MIIDSSQTSDIEVIGDDITEFKTGIDPKNLEFITTLLSSNLYSHPEESFIRETVSNAYDSHIEAENNDDPIIIRFNFLKRIISIRDYGVGISPERFKEIYCNIGSSTKRETNDYIGGFGIGRFSALACSNIVHLTSYYEGKEFYYIMTKDGNNIVTNLIRVTDTNEKNGVEVSIRGIDDMGAYIKALKSIAFFPNIYIDSDRTSEYIHEINKSNIIKYNTYSIINLELRNDKKLLLGNVLYPLDTSILDTEELEFIQLICNSGIAINFNIGELSITPNREMIIYTEETKRIIKERILRVKEEVINNILKDLKELNIRRLLSLCDYYVKYNPTGSFYGGFEYNPEKLLFDDNDMSLYTFEGEHISKNVHTVLKRALRVYICNFSGYITSNTIRKARKSFVSAITEGMLNNKKIVIEGSRITATLGAYLKENYEGYIILKSKVTQELVEQYLNDEFTYFYPALSTIEKDKASDLITRIVNNNIVVLNPSTDYSYNLFKSKVTISSNSSNVPVSLRIWSTSSSSFYMRKYKNEEAALYYIKGIRTGVMITTRDLIKDWYTQVCDFLGYVCIVCNKQFLSKVQECHFSNILSEDKILSHPSIRRLASVNYTTILYPKVLGILPDSSDLRYIINSIAESKKYKAIKVYNSLFDSLERAKIKSDPYTDAMLLKYREISNSVELFLRDNDLEEYCIESPYILAILTKHKVCRISYNKYFEVKNNQVIKMLCAKY